MTSARLAASVAAVVALAGTARAQSVEADVLFREGKRLLKAGKIDEACDKLEASNRIESSVGTLLNLGDCREKNHQLATAWETFRKAARAARLAHDGKRDAEARRREKLLAPRLSYLTIEVSEADRVDGLTITKNGAEIDRQLWNQSVPVDSGRYALAASAPGRVGWTWRGQIDGDAQQISVRVPALEPPPPPPELVPAEELPPRRAREVTRPAPAPASRWTGTRTAAVVLAVAGAGGLGAGIGFGLHGRRLERDADAVCPTTICNDPRALSRNADARRAARDANIGYVAGGGLLGAAVVLWVLGAPQGVAPAVARDRVGLAIVGQF